MFDTSSENPLIPKYLRYVTAVECSVVLFAAVLLFFLPGLAKGLWAWDIPPFNARFVGAIYFAAYIALFIFWYTARWTPGRFVLWMIFVFTGLIMLAMFIHWDAFAWNRPSTFLVFWPLYIFLPVNSAIFLFNSRGTQRPPASNLTLAWRAILFVFSLLSGLYGIGLFFFPEPLTSFWPWGVDAFHARIYASAFVTPAVGAWILAARSGHPSEYLVLGLNLILGGILPILGTLWTNASVSADRQIQLDSGTWIFFIIFLLGALLGVGQVLLAVRKAK
jgi:hypothetical protein